MATAFKSLLVLDCILLLLLALGANAGKCPKNVPKEARRCLRHVQSSHKKHNALLSMLMPPGMNGTKQLCRDGKIQNAFACLNRLYSSCANSRKGMRHLEMMVDVGKWRKSIENICNSLQYLDNYAECEVKARVEFAPCARQAQKTFVEEMKLLEKDLAVLQNTQGVKANMARVNIGCSFSTKLMHCLQEPFEKHCSLEMAVLLRETFQDFMPPACAKRAMQRSVDPHPRYDVKSNKPEVTDSRNDDTHASDRVEMEPHDNLKDKQLDADKEDKHESKTNKKTSYDEEYNDVKVPQSGAIGASRSQKGGAEKGKDAGDKNGVSSTLVVSVGLVTVLGAIQASFYL